jgi:hypothetical protein
MTSGRVGRPSDRDVAGRGMEMTIGALAEPLDDGGVGHAAALAHRLQAVPTAALFKRIHKCGHDAAPLAPSGCPIAIAPPLTLVLARSAPVSCVDLARSKCLAEAHCGGVEPAQHSTRNDGELLSVVWLGPVGDRL